MNGGSATHRAPFQVLVFPYRRRADGGVEYAVFRRRDLRVWQGISGGGEQGETALDAARRELMEEAGASQVSEFISLDSTANIPVMAVVGSYLWGPEVSVIPEYSFGTDFGTMEPSLSDEHVEYKWLGFNEARELLEWDSNKEALRELNEYLCILSLRQTGTGEIGDEQLR